MSRVLEIFIAILVAVYAYLNNIDLNNGYTFQVGPDRQMRMFQ